MRRLWFVSYFVVSVLASFALIVVLQPVAGEQIDATRLSTTAAWEVFGVGIGQQQLIIFALSLVVLLVGGYRIYARIQLRRELSW